MTKATSGCTRFALAFARAISFAKRCEAREESPAKRSSDRESGGTFDDTRNLDVTFDNSRTKFMNIFARNMKLGELSQRIFYSGD